jgi:hypothetical protein
MTISLPVWPIGHAVSSTEWANLVNTMSARTNIDLGGGDGTVSLSTASATYVSATGGTFDFTKQLSATDSNLIVIVSLTAYLATASGTVGFGISDGTTTTDVVSRTVNVVSHHEQFAGMVKLTGMNAGTYTFILRGKTSAGTLTMDANDFLHLVIFEQPIVS